MALSGEYIQQLTGYKAFVPKPLPPEPMVQIEGEMQTLLSRADRALGRLDGSIQTLPDPGLFVFMYVRKEAVLSSQIEGTQSSLNDVIEAEAEILNPDRPKDVDEIFSYERAMRTGLESLKELPVSVRLIKNIHRELMTGVRGENRQPGELRQTQNWIGPQGCGLNDATFVPPPPTMVADCLSDLERFIHDESPIPALIKIGLIHSQFETIHPFLDGNGRVGRLLTTFLLCEREILCEPVLYLSVYFKENRQQYYDLLQNVRDKGDWESWLKFFLTGVAKVSNEATELSRKILDLREQHRTMIIENLGRAAANGLKVLEQLFSRPIVDARSISAITGTTSPAAYGLLNKLIENGMLVEMTGRDRYRRYKYSPYLELFR